MSTNTITESTQPSSAALISSALQANESTLVMQTALLKEVLEAKAGVSVHGDSTKKAAAASTAPASETTPVGDASLNPTQQGMVLLGDLAYLDLLSQQLNGPNPPAWATAAYNNLVGQINQMINSAPAGSIDPTILAFAKYIMPQAQGPLGPKAFMTYYEEGLNSFNYGNSKYPTVVDWISANVSELTSGGNLALAGSVAMFMIDIQYDLVNKNGMSVWSDKFQGLLNFWSSKDEGQPIPDPATQATADLLIYFFWSQAGSPQPGSAGWTAFQTNLENFMTIADPNKGPVNPNDPNSPQASGWANDNVAPQYNTFFQDLQNDLSAWKNGPPVYSTIFVQNFLGVWTSFLTYTGQ